jgi:hypothetical protein
MKIYAISENRYYNRNGIYPAVKCNKIQNTPSFSGNYERMMDNVLRRDLLTKADVEGAMKDLFFASIEEKNITKSPFYPLVSEWLASKGTYLVEELCKPIAKVLPDLRDIIFQAQEGMIPIVKKGDEGLIYISNLGKHGFWNTIFERESATNDTKVIFSAKSGNFEIGTNKKGKLTSEQYMESGYWVENTYNMILGDRIAQKTGDASEPIVPVW